MPGIAARWTDLLDGKRARTHRLHAALLTCYQPPDTGFLVESFLPAVLGLNRSLTDDIGERELFLAELLEALEPMNRRITVVSSVSAADEGREASVQHYPWLFRDYAKWLAVGAESDAVQHAKLWMLHWEPHGKGKPLLEIVVSSANLTASAFRDQLQAGWTHTASISPKASESRRSSWGPLPEFLDALQKETSGSSEIAHFRSLLDHCQCPRGVQVVCSVPGVHGSDAPWGLNGLGAMARRRGVESLRVVAPFIGHFGAHGDRGALADWTDALDLAESAIEVAWIDIGHPWATAGSWNMPKDSAAALRPNLRKLNQRTKSTEPTRLHPDQDDGDARWSHAKLYGMKLRRGKAVVVTSANFSGSAWGRMKGERLDITNFELGVWIDGADWPIQPPALSVFADDEQPFATDDVGEFATDDIRWVQAAWDGRAVTVDVRTRGARPSAVFKATRGSGRPSSTLRPHKTVKKRWSASVEWRDLSDPPLAVHVRAGESLRVVPVADERARCKLGDLCIPEVTPERLQEIKDARLLERYGAMAVEDTLAVEALKRRGGSNGAGKSSGVYSVLAFERARELFQTIDAWQAALDGALDPASRQQVHSDGHRMLAAIERIDSPSARKTREHVAAICAANELRSRLEADRG